MADLGSDPAEFEGAALTCRRGERPVFAGLDFRVASGGALLLTGPNGAGKSSLLRVMAGLLAPADGNLLWNGLPVSADPEGHRLRVGYLGHRDAIKPGMDLVEHLAVWDALQGLAHDAGHDNDRASRIEAALARFGLDRLADLPARYLSAGQRRRLALARLIVAPRPLWLLDEPHAALDSGGVTALESAIASHRAAGGLVVAASHGGLALDGAATLDLAALASSEAA